MKHLANIISVTRILLLLVLFFLFDHALLFLIVYLLCGFSDILDGYVARKTQTQSEFGARLDSFADFILFTVITLSIIRWMENEVFIFLPWIISISIIRLANMFISKYKYHSFAILHTWGNKLAGFLLFIAPLFLLYQQFIILWPVCIIAFLSATEEMLIHITSAKLNLNRQSIFRRDNIK